MIAVVAGAVASALETAARVIRETVKDFEAAKVRAEKARRLPR